MLGKHRGNARPRAYIAIAAAAAVLAVSSPSAGLAAQTSAIGATDAQSNSTIAQSSGSYVKIEPASDGAQHTYRVYKLLDGNVSSDGQRLSAVAFDPAMNDGFWNALEATPEWGVDGPKEGYGAQDAAEWLSRHMQSDASGAFSAKVAAAALASGSDDLGSFSTGTAKKLDGEGLYLFTAADAQPILALAGRTGTLDVNTKSTMPTIETSVRTGDSGDWDTAADVSTGRALQFRTTFTPASNLISFSRYPVKMRVKFSPAFAYRDGSARVVLLGSDGSETDVTDKVAVADENGDMAASCDDLKALAREALPKGVGLVGLRAYSEADLTGEASVGATAANEVASTAECPLSPTSDNVSAVAASASATPKVRTYKVSVRKADADTGAGLNGAGWKVTDAADGKSLDGSAWTDEGSEIVGDGDTATATGLGPGTYEIDETTAPDGYEKAEPMTIQISADEADDGTVSVDCTAQGADARVDSVDVDAGEIHVTVDDEREPESAAIGGPLSTLDKTGDARGPLVALLALIATISGAYGARKKRQTGN